MESRPDHVLGRVTVGTKAELGVQSRRYTVVSWVVFYPVEYKEETTLGGIQCGTGGHDQSPDDGGSRKPGVRQADRPRERVRNLVEAEKKASTSTITDPLTMSVCEGTSRDEGWSEESLQRRQEDITTYHWGGGGAFSVLVLDRNLGHAH